MMMTVLLIAAALLLVLLNGFFVLAEFAMVKVRATRIEQLAREGNRRAQAAEKIIHELDSHLSATQLGITISSIGLGWLGEPAFARLLEGALEGVGLRVASYGLATAAAFAWVTFLHIVIGELVPKSIAIRKPEASALFSGMPLRFFHAAFIFPLWVLNGASNFVLRLVGIPPVRGFEAIASEEELRLVLAHSQKAGVMSFNRLLLVENAFDLGDLRVGDIMVPLERMVAIDLSRPYEENRERILSRRLTRYPVVERPGGPVVGFVHLKQVAIELLRRPQERIELARFLRPVARLRASTPLESALREMQRRRLQIALVEDDSGRPVGIVTMEDVLEELVGDIEDEFEAEQPLRIGEMVVPETILLDPPLTDPHALVDRMLEAARSVAPQLDVEAARRIVWKRDEVLPVATGEGVAIPHARVPGLERPVVAMARVRPGLAMADHSGVPTALVILVLTPPTPAALHVRVLRRIANVLESQFLRVRLLEARTQRECLEVLTIGDADAHV